MAAPPERAEQVHVADLTQLSASDPRFQPGENFDVELWNAFRGEAVRNGYYGVGSNDWETYLADPSQWSDLPRGAWRYESYTAREHKLAATGRETLFGLEAKTVRARVDPATNRVKQFEIIWDEMFLAVEFLSQPATSTMTSQQKAEFRREQRQQEKKMQEDARDFLKECARNIKIVSDNLRQKYGTPTTRILGQSTTFKTQVEEFTTPEGAIIRLWSKEKTLIFATIEPADTASKKLSDLGGMNQTARSELAQKNVVHRANGDVVIYNLPMVDQGPRGYCYGAARAMIYEYWGLALPIDLIAGKYKIAEILSDKIANQLDTLDSSACSEARIRRNKEKPSIPRIQREIDAGRPITIGRQVRGGRTAKHFAWKDAVEIDPNYVIDDPKSPSDRKEWPLPNDPGHVSIITGYNDRRKEFLLTESWGEGARNQRISYDELLETGGTHMETWGP